MFANHFACFKTNLAQLVCSLVWINFFVCFCICIRRWLLLILLALPSNLIFQVLWIVFLVILFWFRFRYIGQRIVLPWAFLVLFWFLILAFLFLSLLGFIFTFFVVGIFFRIIVIFRIILVGLIVFTLISDFSFLNFSLRLIFAVPLCDSKSRQIVASHLKKLVYGFLKVLTTFIADFCLTFLCKLGSKELKFVSYTKLCLPGYLLFDLVK